MLEKLKEKAENVRAVQPFKLEPKGLNARKILKGKVPMAAGIKRRMPIDFCRFKVSFIFILRGCFSHKAIWSNRAIFVAFLRKRGGFSRDRSLASERTVLCRTAAIGAENSFKGSMDERIGRTKNSRENRASCSTKNSAAAKQDHRAAGIAAEAQALYGGDSAIVFAAFSFSLKIIFLIKAAINLKIVAKKTIGNTRNLIRFEKLYASKR